MPKVDKISPALLSTMILGYVTHCDRDQFAKIANLLLIAMGVIDGEGKLKQAYQESAWWDVEDGELVCKGEEIAEKMNTILEQMKDK